jgi:dTDP-4-dehydrorhamnose reductase
VSWLFGAHGHNFVKTILRLAQARKTLRVVDDQSGCPTWAGHVAAVIWSLTRRLAKGGEQIPWGTYHYCDSPSTTWHGLAAEIIGMARERTSLAAPELVAIGTKDYPTSAPRPANSVLSCDLIRRRFGIKQQSWHQGLARTLDALLSLDTDNGCDAEEAVRL